MEVKKSLFQKVYDKVQSSFFNITLDLLKEKETSQYTACGIIFVMFSQVFALLFESSIFHWSDSLLLSYFVSFCDYIRIIGAINSSQNAIYYWILFYVGLAYIIILIVLMVYLHLALQNIKFYFEILVRLLGSMLLFFYWVFFMPFFESFISIFKCQNGYHYIDTSMECFQSQHIIMMFLACMGLVFLLGINIIVALLYNENQPIQIDCLSRLETNFEIIMLFYRVFIASFSLICTSEYCSWVLVVFYLLSSSLLAYQYYIQIPYYNSFVSVFFGSLVCTYFWISINALIMQLVTVDGHIIIILVGLPIIVFLVKNLREMRIETLMHTTMEKISNDVDALIQITTIKDWSIGKIGVTTSEDSIDQEMQVKGIIQQHIDECKNDICICKNLEELYDVGQQSYLHNTEDLHNEIIFLGHYNKKMYEEALNKFINCPNIHISFSYYLFQVMKNIHAALHELNVAAKKKPTLQQQFTIFRYRKIIEKYIHVEEHKNKHIYQQLTNVKEFERLYYEMQKSIEFVCNYQVEFWTHLTTVVPDLNTLNELGDKIYNFTQQAESYWRQLCKINSAYTPALLLYGEFISYIRNYPQVGKEYMDQVMNANKIVHNSMDDLVKKSDVLFTEDATVVHISGNKDSSGRVLKVSQGLQKCFGYNKSEVIGHNVNFLMPNLIGNRHNDLLDKFYKTGRQRVFNVERVVFCHNRQGHCFSSKILVKQMPSLKEGIQYVGMLRPIYTEYEYILTDLSGNIDSFSAGITSLLGLNPQLFKDNQGINIQILCPELITIFEQRRLMLKKAQQISEAKEEEKEKNDPDKVFMNHKLSQSGGDSLAIIVVNNFAALAKSEKQQKSKGNGKKKAGNDVDAMGGQKINRTAIFREFLKYLSKGRTYGKKCPDIKKLLTCKEYKDFEKLKIVQCELNLEIVKTHRSEHNALKFLVFKVKKAQGKNNMPDEELDEHASEQDDIDNGQALKNASSVIQEAYGQKDPADQLGRQGTVNMNRQGTRQGVAAGPKQSLRRGQTDSDDKQEVRFSHEMGLSISRDSLANNQRANIVREGSPGGKPQKRVGFVEGQAQDKSSGNKQKMAIANAVTFIEEVKESKDSEGSQKSWEGQPNKSKVVKKKEVKKATAGKKEVNNDNEETPRIDVKKDITINDEIKKKTQHFSDSMSASLKKGQSKTTNNQDSITENDKLLPKQEDIPKKELPVSSKKLLTQQEKVSQDDDGEGEEDESASLLNNPVQNMEDLNKKEIEKEKDKVEELSGEMEEVEEEMEEEYEEIEEEGDDDAEYYNEMDQQDVSSQQDMLSSNTQRMGQSGYHSRFELPQIMAQPKKKKHRNYERIVTNPKYKHLDLESCGSAYFKDVEVTNEEMDIRDMIKRVEDRKRKRQERNMRRQQAQQQDQIKKELTSEIVLKEEASIKDDDDQDDDELNASNDNDQKEKEKQLKQDQEDEEDSKDQQLRNSAHGIDDHDQGEVSSIASSIFSQARSNFALRLAIEEKFVPVSIKNLQYVSYLVFLSLLALDISYFSIQVIKFTQIGQNIQNIHYSELRVGQIVDINLRIQNMIHANERIVSESMLYGLNYSTYINIQNQLLINSTTALKDSQTFLSLATIGFSIDEQTQINPQNVTIEYFNAYGGLPSIESYNIWESIMTIVVSSYSLTSQKFNITSNNTLVQFIQNNCLNSNMNALKQSTEAIMTATSQMSTSTLSLFLYLLVIISCSLILSVCFLLPVIMKAKQQKQEVLELFLSKKIEKIIDDQLKTCRWFLTKHQIQQETFGQMQGGDAGHDDQNIDDNMQGVVDKNEIKKDQGDLYGLKSKKKKRKWKKLNSNLLFLALRALAIVAVFEAFFIADYLASKTFLNEVTGLTSELQLLISRQPQLTFLLLLQKQLIYYKNQTNILYQPIETVIQDQFQSQAMDQQLLLDIFSVNYQYHSTAYNDKFSQLMYSNMCSNFTFNDSTNTEISESSCELADIQILQKGLYSSIIYFWTLLRNSNQQFLLSSMMSKDVSYQLNNYPMTESERLVDIYFKESHADLVAILESDIGTIFSYEYKIDRIIFIVFLVYLALVYSIIWRIFVRKLMEELWKSKALLCILPVEVCFKLDEVRVFIYNNSSTKRNG